MTDRSRSNIDDTSASSQRVRLLERLQLGPVDTITARTELNVLHAITSPKRQSRKAGK